MKGLIFDFDGVIVLSEGPRFKVLRNIARECGFEIKDELIQKMIGRSTRGFLGDVLPATDEEIGKVIEGYEKEYKGNIAKYAKPNTPVVEFIREFKRDDTVLALVTMSTQRITSLMLKNLKIYTKFKLVVTREGIINHKPHPEIYLKALEKLGIEPKACMAIEDTKLGAESALAAGVKCFAILNGFNSKGDFTGLKIEGFVKTKEDLEKIVS